MRQVLKAYAAYYNHVLTHLALTKDAPLSRPVHRFGDVIAKLSLHKSPTGHGIGLPTKRVADAS